MAAKELSSRLPSGLKELQDRLQDKSYFKLSTEQTLFLLNRAFPTEIDNLKTAYVSVKFQNQCTTPRHSQVLFSKDYDEIDRTLTGVLALQWLYNGDYATFTKGQRPGMMISKDCFRQLRSFYSENTQGFKDYETLLILIMLQVTNDLGKSEALVKTLHQRLGASNVSHNHDVVMSQVMVHPSTISLIPSFKCMRSDQQDRISKHIRLSAQFNPGQFGQAECPPGVLDILKESGYGDAEITLKYMESFLDLAGALGHKNHEGAQTLSQPVFRSYWQTYQLARRVAINHEEFSPKEAFNTLLTDRIAVLAQDGWAPASEFNISRLTDYAKVRIFCMGRVVKADLATKYNRVYDALPNNDKTYLEIGLGTHGKFGKPAVLPYYAPQMLQNAAASDNFDSAVTAILKYLSRVVWMTSEDRNSLPRGTTIVERDVMPILGPLIASDEFKKNPSSIINEQTPLPETTFIEDQSPL